MLRAYSTTDLRGSSARAIWWQAIKRTFPSLCESLVWLMTGTYSLSTCPVLPQVSGRQPGPVLTPKATLLLVSFSPVPILALPPQIERCSEHNRPHREIRNWMREKDFLLGISRIGSWSLLPILTEHCQDGMFYKHTCTYASAVLNLRICFGLVCSCSQLSFINGLSF